MSKPQTHINPGKAGPKGALAERDKHSRKQPPSSGAPGNEGNNTRRDFVRLDKHAHRHDPKR